MRNEAGELVEVSRFPGGPASPQASVSSDAIDSAPALVFAFFYTFFVGLLLEFPVMYLFLRKKILKKAQLLLSVLKVQFLSSFLFCFVAMAFLFFDLKRDNSFVSGVEYFFAMFVFLEVFIVFFEYYLYQRLFLKKAKVAFVETPTKKRIFVAVLVANAVSCLLPLLGLFD